MTKLSQHQAVVNFAKQVLGEKFQAGRDIKDYITKDEKRQVTQLVAESIFTGETELSAEAMAKYGTSIENLATKYVAGMVTNWFNKSKELNGGIKYETKNPGSRAGSSDPIIREMKLLAQHLREAGNEEGLAKVEAAIAERLAETSKPKQKEINLSILPDHLKDLVS